MGHDSVACIQRLALAIWLLASLAWATGPAMDLRRPRCVVAIASVGEQPVVKFTGSCPCCRPERTGKISRAAKIGSGRLDPGSDGRTIMMTLKLVVHIAVPPLMALRSQTDARATCERWSRRRRDTHAAQRSVVRCTWSRACSMCRVTTRRAASHECGRCQRRRARRGKRGNLRSRR